MKKLLLAVVVALVFNVPVYAGTTHDFKTMAAKLFRAPQATASLKSQKDDLAIVYGGEDVVARKIISSDSYNV